MNSTESFQNLKTETKTENQEKVQKAENWTESDWYKEWVRLAHINHPEPKKCGYWYYDNNDRTYKYSHE